MLNPVNKLPISKTCSDCKKFEFCKKNKLCDGPETWCAWINPNKFEDKEITL